ncbi:MAG: hypothetical protein OHK0046_26540 [Anaerolineae bacterium]
MAKILVIEDAELLRNDVLEMLRFEGYDVVGAENGQVGVDMALQHQPDLIICDIMMPELDGYGVLDALRQDNRTLSTPFIFLTAKSDRTEIRHGMGLGVDDYLTKPFIASELLETVHARLVKQNTFADMIEAKLRTLSDNIITALPHELRTPLNTIIGFSEMLITEAHRLSPDQTIEWSSHINHAAQRLYRLVENYLLYVRAEIVTRDTSEMDALRGKYVEQPDTFVAFHALHKAEQHRRVHDLIINGDNHIRVHVSDQDLGKIVEELVDNALKFSKPDTPIVVSTTVEDDRYVLSIQDQGHGMTADQIKSIGAYMQFERWFYEQQGSGFGLTIARRLVDLYDGQLIIDSLVDHGTCIKVSLHLA